MSPDISGSSAPLVLITGANRGIGLAFCQLYVKRGWQVLALCRNASPALNDLSHNSGLQVFDGIEMLADNVGESIAKIVKSLNKSIDLLINNAGILRDESLTHFSLEQMREQFEVNTLGPLKVSQALYPYIKPHGKMAFITSRMGSITDNTSGGRYGYRMSKAALNIAAVSLACDLSNDKISVGIFHPGLVATDMIGGHGDISADQAAERLMQRIDELNADNSGSFFHSNGEPLPW